ncbi:thioredoxin-2-like [Diorhabda sublineata]|uniref:thioredoxin-2-like n=1 Tax=Diorhabda sublineata TaxID=1163346 RepID=UPI0024E0F06F|nr:thioredoxin-2-like [Diorhabda sublineata]
MLVKITDETHMQQQMTEYEQSDQLLVIEFFATWCAPCRAFAPKLAEIAETVPYVPFLLVDVDDCDEIAATYKVMATPYFIFLKRGQVVDKFAGANLEKFKNIIDEHSIVPETVTAVA